MKYKSVSKHIGEPPHTRYKYEYARIGNKEIIAIAFNSFKLFFNISPSITSLKANPKCQ